MSVNPGPSRPPHLSPPWGILATVAWMLGAFLASLLIATAAFAVWQGDRSLPTNGYDGVVIAIGALTSVPVQIGVLVFAARLRGWAAADYLAFNWPRRGEVIFAAICVIAVDLAFDGMLYASGRELVPAFQAEAYQTAKNAGGLFWLTLAIVVVAPIGEEVAFRGFLYRGLVRPGSEMIAIVVIALAWALLHIQYDWLGMAQIFLAGVMLGWFRWASGSTSLAIFMHILVNIEAMLETMISVEFFS